MVIRRRAVVHEHDCISGRLGDIVAYRCACTAENDPEYVAFSRIDELLERIFQETGASNHHTFIGGKGNWRKEIYPEYKANRKDKPKPVHLSACLEYLRSTYSATSVDGLEADDLMSITQYEYAKKDEKSVICSIDKDLLQVPGLHYNFVKSEHLFITPLQGLRRFYGQVLSGDGSDNVPSYDGKVRNSIPKFIQHHLHSLDEMTEEKEMYNYCADVYSDQVSWADDWQTPLHKNASVLYMLREHGVFWKPPDAVE